MTIALTIIGIALVSLSAVVLLTVVAVGVAELWMRSRSKGEIEHVR